MRLTMALLLAASCAANLSAEPSRPDGREVVHHPLGLGALQEFGLVRSGVIGGNVLSEVKDEWIDHFGVSITQRISVDRRFHVSGGLGGIFQFRKPEIVNGGFPGSQRKAFFIGPTTAEAAYHFGNPDQPLLKLGIGMFPFKYNPEASNLGEYLFRSVPYPSVIMTGGYVIANSAGAHLQGIKSEGRFGDFRLDALLLTETSLAPLYDGSLALIGTWAPGTGWLEVGVGVNFKRLLQVYPERTTRTNKSNGWFVHGGRKLSANFAYYNNQATFWRTRAEGATASESARYLANAASNDSIAALIESFDALPAVQRPAIHHYTAAGTVAMARVTLDLRKRFGWDALGKEDLKVFTEAAVLGWKDYPVFYEDRLRRMPVMAGVNIPAFGMLDRLSLQVEYFDSPWLNNTWPIGSDGNNIPFIPDPSDRTVSRDAWYDMAGRDNLKWSLLLTRKVHSHVTLHAQVASDHLRIADASSYYGPQLNPNEITLRKRDWHATVQLAWGI